ncbi:NAD-dependent succinate-semialdehyde dehydrogenase [Thiohalophilus thiocyanatoxydans]|uniref:Succinate-semialdehyde dehydrogenase/glutarate-semialdehyde dehydrogenase n=1 Tax=Thiohalophilus thiocyanatoxydans TaxID=381308 RepID=A0A4R8IJG2_9GAMM|nr:NAD-dependent succinate-semialdehyde dehydrogenase [Thiohalophilus thiocyanatoxydans]TDX98188.1 succinate-semialdehyde dehydrogenase/glutarate-semialdehyde dehydrogenase [Thiohalophilus thiocyanatoxydans]
MSFEVINPATGEKEGEFSAWEDARIDQALEQAAEVAPQWRALTITERCELMRGAARVLRDNKEQYATLITREMGKLINEARGEIEKCAWVCDYYADKAPEFLHDEPIESDAGKSYVAYQPLGTVLAVMPWNFPFWQVFRFAAPALCAGNTGLLKHASNVPQCAQAIEAIFREAGFPDGVFTALMIRASQVEKVIEDPRVQAVTLTGSEPAGRKVAATAGAALKKSVLELGGSDAFVVLEDADLDEAVKNAVASRFLNAGQSCIAAKRFIVVDAIAEDFVARFKAGVESLKPGDPLDENTSLAPMARSDLREEMHKQVVDSLAAGAVNVTGCDLYENMPGAYYKASILDQVGPGMRAYSEELFGPVAIVIRARDEADALRIANDTTFGLGGNVWTRDSDRGERLARQLDCGCCFVNSFVKSDPRLPFGGIKNSGYGRELSHHGIHEFVNAKTVWIK